MRLSGRLSVFRLRLEGGDGCDGTAAGFGAFIGVLVVDFPVLLVGGVCSLGETGKQMCTDWSKKIGLL